MNKNFIRRAFGFAFLILGVGSALAEDIDIYSQNTSVTPGAPNVLIILDNSANWATTLGSGTKADAEKAALVAVVSALKTQFNLGLMMFTDNAPANNNSAPGKGAYVRFSIKGMSNPDGTATTARTDFVNLVNSLSTSNSGNDNGSGGYSGLAMAEAYYYYSGSTAYAGWGKANADATAFTIKTSTNGVPNGKVYDSPITENCQKNFIIYIGNGHQTVAAQETEAQNQLTTLAGANASAPIPPDANDNSKNNESDEWARYLYKSNVVVNGISGNVVTYSLEVGPGTSGNNSGYYTSLLQSMGTQGKGGYFSATDAVSLNAALTRIFNDIQAVNSVFASASLPLSADNTGAFLNQVYMGVFRPDAQGKQRWLGNVKQYAFAVNTNGNLYLVDSSSPTPLPAAGAAGFATPDAVSFWTSKDPTKAPDATFSAATSAANGSTGGFWYFDNKGSGGAFDSQDGEWVEKGGAAQQLRLAHLGYGGRGGIGDNNDSMVNSSPARQVLTCIGSCLSTTPTTGTTLTAAANRATTWFEVANTAIDSPALGLTNTIPVASITNPALGVTRLSTGPSITLIHVDNGNGKPAIVTTSAAHGFSDGDSVTVAGSNIASYNGTWTISNASGTSFRFGSFTGTADANTGTAAKTNSTVAFVTATSHGLLTGQKVVIAGASPAGFNNAAAATAITVLDANTFKYTVTSAVTGPATGTVTYTGQTARATAAAHPFVNGASVTVAGSTPSIYNGTFTVRNVTADTFDYSYSGADPTQANATGTLTATNTTANIRDSLVRWSRGLDTADENGFKVNGNNTDVRASIHGDVLHSRPLVLNYSASANSNNVYVFYGGNDGIYRAIKGGQAATDGKEQWAFIPQEFFPKLQRMYSNSPDVKYPSTPATGIVPTPTTRDYTFDGPVGSYIHRDSTGAVDRAILFISVRRGGRFIYALDVTSPTAPKFLWRKGSGDTGFAELGQTWSQPIVATIKAQTNPVLIFGAGYDAASEDTDIPAVTDALGRAVYVLDAFTGAPIWAAGKATNFGTLPSGMKFKSVSGMNFSFAADMQVVDRTLDGIADRIYAVDVGANVWRIDISATNPDNWTVWKIASLGQRTNAAASGAARKVLFSPDVVLGDSFDAIIVGTGDREHPLATSTATNGVANRIYMIKDPNIGTAGADLGLVDSCGMTVTSGCSSFFDATGGAAVPTTAYGWSVNLATGEKVVNGPLVTAGNVIFGTNQPDTSNQTCNANLGIARRYDIDYLTGVGAGAFKDANGNVVLSEVAVGGGFLPSPVSGVVQIGGVPYLFTTDNPLNPGGVIPITVNVTQKRFRTYWREKLE